MSGNRRLSVLLGLALGGTTFVCGTTRTAAARPIPIDDGSNSSPVTVVINSLTLDATPAPYILDGRTMVPLRAIFEALGATVTWDGQTQTATATNGKHTLQVTIGKPTIRVDRDLTFEMDVPAQIIANRTFLPLRYTAAALGAAVDWDQTTHTALIAQPGSEGYNPLLEGKLDRILDVNVGIAADKQLEFVRQCNDPVEDPRLCPMKKANEFYRWVFNHYTNGEEFDLKRQIDWRNIEPFVWHGHEVTPRDAGNINYGYVMSHVATEETVWSAAGMQEMWTLVNQGANPLVYCFDGHYRCEDPDSARGIELGIQYFHERTGP